MQNYIECNLKPKIYVLWPVYKQGVVQGWIK